MRFVWILSFLLVSCSKEAPKLAFDPSTSPKNKYEGEANETFHPKVDVLFVVDNSGSMASHQALLASNIDLFVNKFIQAGTLDFHVGVVTTDVDNPMFSGRLVGNPKFVENNTHDAVKALAQNLLVGTNGSGWERSFEPVRLALSNPLLDGQNAGFYRDDAHLAIIFLTDAEDQSDMTPSGFLDFLKGLKPRTDRILAYGAIVPSTDTSGCPRDEGTPPTKIEFVLNAVSNAGKNVMSLCDPQYGDKLSEMTDDLINRIGRTIYLKRRPILSTVKLIYGKLVVPREAHTGWAYNPQENTIILGSQINWASEPPGTKLKIIYDALPD